MKRRIAGIAGIVLATKLGYQRSKLCEIERDYYQITAEESRRIEAAIEELITAKAKIEEKAKEVGWPGRFFP